MKKLILIIFFSGLIYQLNAQIYFAGLQEILPNDDTKYLVGDEQNRAKKISHASLKYLLGVGIYPIKVTTVATTNNPNPYRNKIVQTIDSLNYWVDWSGNSILLGSFSTSLNDVVTKSTAQTITGKKTFTDTVIINKGLKSGGVIETKGINTEGATNKAAATFGGVQKKKWRLITANTSLDGTDLWLEIQCSTSDITIVLPSISASDGWTYDVKRTDNTAYVVKFQRPDGSFIRILNKRAATLRNNGSQWNFD